jgi:hypothetical protein
VMDGSGWRGIGVPSRGASRAAGTSRPRTIPTGSPPSTRSWAPPLVDPIFAGSRRRGIQPADPCETTEQRAWAGALRAV